MLKAFKMGTSKIKATPTISKFTYCNLFLKIGSQKVSVVILRNKCKYYCLN